MLQVVTDFYLNLQLTSLQIIVVSKFFLNVRTSVCFRCSVHLLESN